ESGAHRVERAGQRTQTSRVGVPLVDTRAVVAVLHALSRLDEIRDRTRVALRAAHTAGEREEDEDAGDDDDDPGWRVPTDDGERLQQDRHDEREERRERDEGDGREQNEAPHEAGARRPPARRREGFALRPPRRSLAAPRTLAPGPQRSSAKRYPTPW